MRAVLISTALAGAALANDDWQRFEEFKAKYNLRFQSQDENSKRFDIFKKNMEKAAELTKKSKKAQFGMTKFSHLTPEEFKKQSLGYVRNPKMERPPKKTSFKHTTVGTIDWRKKGAVSPVKDQGQCGSCWAFSATEALETGYFFQTGNMKVLSPQQTVSCDHSDMGCGGGDTSTAYSYMRSAGGIEPESAYPYTSGDTEHTGSCHAHKSEFVVKAGQSQTISSSEEDEDAMFKEIQESPMSICVDAESWQTYQGGVVDINTCGQDLDHCVQVVGMKKDEYWIVRNSWNTDWGEDGFIRVKTGQNACGIAMEATIVDGSDEDSGKFMEKKTIDPKIIDIIEGISEGFGLKMEKECVDDSTTFVTDLQQAYDLMNKKTPAAMAEAMRLLAQALETEWPGAAKACGATVTQVDQILATLQVLKHPKQFAYHVGHDLVINGIDIYSNTNDAVGHWKKQEYHDFGASTGKALSLLLVGGEDTVYV